MHNFEVLFDHSEAGGVEDAALAGYGRLTFPVAPLDRPWIYSNFVQSLDGIVSLRGKYGSGSAIAQSEEDRWLMDALRAHTDALIMGINSLVEERYYMGGHGRGPVFKIADPEMLKLRERLGRGRQKNIFLTNSATIRLCEYRVFDGELVDAYVVTTRAGADRLRAQRHPTVKIIEAGEWPRLDLALAIRKIHQELGVRYLLCEGGPTLYGSMARAGLIDEKFVTVAPVEVGQMAPSEQEMTEFDKTRVRPTTFGGQGFTKDNLSRWTWISSRRVGDHEFNRYRKKELGVGG
ncbi:MAG: RibD family protein [Terriglobales bacterium]